VIRLGEGVVVLDVYRSQVSEVHALGKATSDGARAIRRGARPASAPLTSP
jgi:hypothetical protein